MLSGSSVVTLRGSIPQLASETIMDYHAIVCERARVLATFVIRIYPGTYVHYDPKSNKKRKKRIDSHPGL